MGRTARLAVAAAVMAAMMAAMMAACSGGEAGRPSAASPEAPWPAVPPAAAAPADAPPRLRLVRCASAPELPVRATRTTSPAGAPSAIEGDGQGSGGLLPDEAGEMAGGFGYGRGGFGPGSGGLGTIGHGSGYGVSSGGAPHRTGGPTTTISVPSATGDLDKAIIRRYIKRNVSKFTYCYEKALLSKPELAGVVVTEFTIGADGRVISARAKGVDDAVAGCVAGVVMRIEFPRPPDGGEVAVTYPFRFDPGDGSARRSSAPRDERWVDAPAPPPPPPPPPPPSWTPYARDLGRAAAASPATAAAVEASVAGQLPALDACFPAVGGPRGALRIVAQVDATGAIAPDYTGGLGDPGAEACVQRVIDALAVVPGAAADVACDLVRGDDAPWRLTRDGYDVLEVSHDGVRFHDQAVTAPLAAGLRERSTVLIIASATATTSDVERAIAWIGGAHPVVLAFARDATTLEYVSAFRHDDRLMRATRGVPRAAIQVRAGLATACVAGRPLDRPSRLADDGAPAALATALQTACGGAACGPVVELVPDGDRPFADALPVVVALRRAGFEPLIAARPSTPGCP